MLLSLVRAAVRPLGVQRLAKWLERLELPASAEVSPDAVAGSVVAAGRGNADQCLAEALTLWSMLRRRGVAAELVFGVDPSGEQFEAHAWVEVDGHVLIGGVERPRFQELWRR